MSTIPNIAVESEQNVMSVSQLSALIQNTLTNEFSGIRIKGEISGLKIHTSGHAYFNLKDENSVINAICWRGTVSKLKMRLEEGLEVVVYGNINTYPARSNYQIVCNDITVAGVGALMALLEERKKKLAAEGLFDAARKKPLPYMPNVIGVITSPTGAVIKDILHRIADRFGVHVLVYPVAVQGEGAAQQVAEGIEFFNNSTANKPDVLIVARGGGSIEDLWAFNEEIVVRAAANSNIPLISAVGHETDTTLIDFASDRRAPTPTAAAEMALPVKAEIMAGIMELKARGFAAVNRFLENYSNILRANKQSLISPKQMLMNMAQRLDDIGERLNSNISFAIKSSESNLKSLSTRYQVLGANLLTANLQKLQNYKQLLESYNYKNVMKRGYALVKKVSVDRVQSSVEKKDFELVKSSKSLNSGDVVTLEFYDGSKGAVIGGGGGVSKPKISKPQAIKEQGENTSQKAPKPIKTAAKPKNSTNESQGSLF